MFSWLLPDQQGLQRISEQFGEMLTDGRRIFDEASELFLSGGDTEAVAESVRVTDRRINATEQQIRRELIVHLTVRGGADAHVCLRMMSLVKDAERIGDYAKNILDLAGSGSGLAGDPLHAELVALKPEVHALLERMHAVYAAQDEDGARSFCEEADVILRRCDARVDELLADSSACSHPIATALMFRYVKRVMAHASNIVSALFMPLDKLDYFDEKPSDRGAP